LEKCEIVDLEGKKKIWRESGEKEGIVHQIGEKTRGAQGVSKKKGEGPKKSTQGERAFEQTRKKSGQKGYNTFTWSSEGRGDRGKGTSKGNTKVSVLE